MSAEAKVGAFAIGGIMMLGAAMFALGNIHLGSSDDLILYANFKQVIGLEPKATVRLRGVPIGRVEEIENEIETVSVMLKVNPDIQIPKDSVATISTVGVMGEKFVNITPGKDTSQYLNDGDRIKGVEESGMDAMFAGMEKTLDNVDELLKAMRSIIGDETFKKSVVDMSSNMKDASAHVNGLVESLEKTAKGNEDNINQMVSQMQSVLSKMDASMSHVEHMTSNIDKFAGDPQTAENLKTTLQNISETSKSVADMAQNINKFAGDPKVAEDMKATVSNARSITERADKILTKVQGTADKISKVDVTPSVDLLYSGKRSDWNANVNVEVTSDRTSLNLGVEDVGDGSKINAQVGKRFNDLGARAGVVAGKIGLGVDAYAGNKWKFSAEAYDPNDFTLRLKSQYKVADSTYILGEWHEVNHKDDRAVYVGIKQEF